MIVPKITYVLDCKQRVSIGLENRQLKKTVTLGNVTIRVSEAGLTRGRGIGES